MGKSHGANRKRTREQITDYLEGRLDDDALETFETRMFADPELSTEVERAAELRAAFRETAGVPTWRRTQWVPLAAAAAVAALAVTVWVGQRQIEPLPAGAGTTPRGQSTTLAVEVKPSENRWTASWERIPEATNYELRVYRDDGSVVYERELPGDTTRHRFVLDDAVTGQKLLRVRALDSFHDVRADSGLIPLPED